MSRYRQRSDEQRQNPRHINDVDRLLMERNVVFGQDSINQGENLRESNDAFGEITGNNFEGDDVGRGLPVRSQYTIRKPIHDPNEHLDFKLFDDSPSKLNVRSNDTSGGSGIGFADVSSSMTKISTQINPVTINSSQIERLNNNLFYYLFDLYSGENYIINGFGFYNLFAAMCLSCSGISELELKKFFDFPQKDVLYKGLLKINDSYASIKDMINIKNFFIVGNDVPYNPHYYDSIKDFCILIRANTANPVNESEKVNMLIRKIMGCNLRHPITPDHLRNLQLMFLTTATVHPVWACGFDKITKGIFQGPKRVYCNYLHSVGKSFGYFEDNLHQILEIKCNKGLVMGFILHKQDMVADIDDNKLHFYISHMKDMVLDEVKIPMFQQDLKMRFNSTFKNLGLQSIFMRVTAPNFFPEGIVLQDIIQNIRIIVDDAFVSNNGTNRGYRTVRKFIADVPFIYYFRMTGTDTILLMGVYNQ